MSFNISKSHGLLIGGGGGKSLIISILRRVKRMNKLDFYLVAIALAIVACVIACEK